MAKRKRTNKDLHSKLRIEQHELRFFGRVFSYCPEKYDKWNISVVIMTQLLTC